MCALQIEVLSVRRTRLVDSPSIVGPNAEARARVVAAFGSCPARRSPVRIAFDHRGAGLAPGTWLLLFDAQDGWLARHPVAPDGTTVVERERLPVAEAARRALGRRFDFSPAPADLGAATRPERGPMSR